MSKTRKILSVVLALAMVFATLAVTASAAYYYEDEESATENTQVWTLGTPVDTGDGLTYTVDVSLTTNYPTGTIQFVVENTDNTNVALSGVTVGAAIPATYNAVASYSNTTGKVIIVPQTALNSDSITATAIDGVIATLTYTYSGTGGATINIEEAPKSATTTDGSLIAARISDGDLVTGDLITGQTATFVTNEQTIGSAFSPADLAIKGAYANSGIIIDTNKTFGNEYDGVVYGFTLPDNGATKVTEAYYGEYLEATNGGYLTVVNTPYVARPKSYGTGTKIQVYSSDDSLSKEYLVVLFGDVDGTGLINITDVTKAVSESDVAGTLALPQVMAINVRIPTRGTASARATALYTVAITDITDIVAVIDAPAEIQVALAEAHTTYSATNYQ